MIFKCEIYYLTFESMNIAMYIYVLGSAENNNLQFVASMVFVLLYNKQIVWLLFVCVLIICVCYITLKTLLKYGIINLV